MHPFADAWKFTRERLAQAYQDLNEEQLLWRPYHGAHNTGELIYHMAGAEHYWATRMTERDPRATEWEAKLDRAVREGFLREGTSSPFGPEEMKMELLDKALEFTGLELGPILENPTQKQLEMKMESPIGPIVTGYEGLLRIVQHAGYHTGQIWTYRMDPRFP